MLVRYAFLPNAPLLEPECHCERSEAISGPQGLVGSRLLRRLAPRNDMSNLIYRARRLPCATR
jgi:hypothetical protein